LNSFLCRKPDDNRCGTTDPPSRRTPRLSLNLRALGFLRINPDIDARSERFRFLIDKAIVAKTIQAAGHQFRLAETPVEFVGAKATQRRRHWLEALFITAYSRNAIVHQGRLDAWYR
jgi:hypothetical protein